MSQFEIIDLHGYWFNAYLAYLMKAEDMLILFTAVFPAPRQVPPTKDNNALIWKATGTKAPQSPTSLHFPSWIF